MYNLTKKKISTTDIIILILIIFISFVLPLLFKKQNEFSNFTIKIIDNTYFKTLLFLLIAFISKINIRIALFTLILVLTTIDTTTKYKFDNNINLTLEKSQNNIKQLKQKIINNTNVISDIPLVKIPIKETTPVKIPSIKIPSVKIPSVKEQYEPNNLNSNYSSYDNFGLLL